MSQLQQTVDAWMDARDQGKDDVADAFGAVLDALEIPRRSNGKPEPAAVHQRLEAGRPPELSQASWTALSHQLAASLSRGDDLGTWHRVYSGGVIVGHTFTPNGQTQPTLCCGQVTGTAHVFKQIHHGDFVQEVCGGSASQCSCAS